MKKGTGGKPRHSLIRTVESEATLRGWSPQRHHAARQRGTVFKTRAIHEKIGCFATTLLASVERCSGCWTQ